MSLLKFFVDQDIDVMQKGACVVSSEFVSRLSEDRIKFSESTNITSDMESIVSVSGMTRCGRGIMSRSTQFLDYITFLL